MTITAISTTIRQHAPPTAPPIAAILFPPVLPRSPEADVCSCKHSIHACKALLDPSLSPIMNMLLFIISMSNSIWPLIGKVKCIVKCVAKFKTCLYIYPEEIQLLEIEFDFSNATAYQLHNMRHNLVKICIEGIGIL